VSYYPQHVGHECELAHIRLHKEDRQSIASKLVAGIPFDDVLDNIHLNAGALQPTDLHLVSKDLHNIERDFGIDSGEVWHRNDADSVAAWIEHTKLDSKTQNFVRYVKFQGETEVAYKLNCDDFILVLASDAQLIGARQFCGPGRAACLDSTHGVNKYDFQLTTLLAVDEHGEGFPVAFCYSSRVDQQTMSVFLDVCKTALGGPLRDVILMTDDTEVYSIAWTAVMGEPAHRLLCTWHVDRAWRKNLPRIKGDSETKAVLYKTIRSLMELTEKEAFHRKLAQFISSASEDASTKEFGKYFADEYASRPQLWAYCYRIGLHVHHNMHLEAMHRVLKHVHMQGRKVKRLDNSIHALMCLLRQKMSDRLLKIHRGKWTKHVRGIRMRHAVGVNLPAQKASCVEANKVYTVAGMGTALYTVRQADTVPHALATCPLVCRECNACVHTFSCTWLDSALRNTICKHVHLVVKVYKPVRHSQHCLVGEPVSSTASATQQSASDTDAQAVIDPTTVPEVSVECDIDHVPASVSDISESEAVLGLLSCSQSDNYERHIAAAHVAWSQIDTTMQSHPALAKVAAEHLVRLQSLLMVLQTKPDVPRLPVVSNEHEPSNKRVAKQRHFMSTRRAKRTKQQLTASKPSRQEKEFLLKALDGNVPVISSQPPADHDYSGNVLCHTVNFEHSYVQ